MREFTKNRQITVTMVTRRKPSELGGVERVVSGLMTELTRARPVWCVNTISAFREGSRIEHVNGLSDMFASLRLGWQLRSSTADVILVHCPECLWGVRLLRRRRQRRPPVIAVWHGAGPKRFLILRKPGHLLARALAWLRTIEEKRAVSADGHIAVHASLIDDLRSLYGLNKPITVIENAIDTKFFNQLSQLDRTSKRAGLTAIWIGQTDYGKGLDVAMAAVAQASRDLPDLRLIVAGVPAGRPADGIDWRGVIPSTAVTEIYRDADLLIFPTRYEAFPLVVIEAMAAGLPVVVSDSVPAGIVTDGRNGVVIAGQDPAHYAVALRRLADPQIRATMSEANRQDVWRFSIKQAVEDYASVIESFVEIQ
jgi:glycosyltransferase involved in cell wall biosynthesis